MNSFFLDNCGSRDNWIINKIAKDIKCSLEKQGALCNMGSVDEYNNEETVFHMYYHMAVPFESARHNSVFITHLDDQWKENEVYKMKDKFDSFICMSEEDAQFLVELGFDTKKVFGKALPARNTYVRPISIGIFSACYPDGRKNESWLLNYCKKHEVSKLANFVFIGKGWERVVQELVKLKCTIEWHNVSRELPYEYQFQQNMLSELDYYLYMGMDGGAMGTYDAYAQGVTLCVTDDGFHKSIPYVDVLFDNENSFETQLDEVLRKQQKKIDFFKEHNPERYTQWLVDVWGGVLEQPPYSHDASISSYQSVKEKRRSNYFPMSWHRIRRVIAGRIIKYRIGRN